MPPRRTTDRKEREEARQPFLAQAPADAGALRFRNDADRLQERGVRSQPAIRIADDASGVDGDEQARIGPDAEEPMPKALSPISRRAAKSSGR